MIPETYKVEVAENKPFELLPEDTYHVQITDIELLEDQPLYDNPDQTEDQFSFEFTIVEDGQYKNRKLWKRIRPIMSAGFAGGNSSSLYNLYCAVHNTKLDKDELEGVGGNQINALVGKQLRLVVKQKANNKGVIRNRIEDVLPLKQGTAPVTWAETAQTEPAVNVEDIPF